MRKFFSMAAVVTALFSMSLLSGCGGGGGKSLDPDPTPTPPPTPTPSTDSYKFNSSKDKVILNHEFRAAWLTTVGGYDWPDGVKDATAQQTNLKNMIHSIKAANCNAVVMQVCCNSDAMWPSSILPWSSVLTGTLGKDPGYDPLAIAVQTAHNDGLEIHAWLNPLRIGSTSTVRPANHPAVMHPDWVQTYGSNYYWDPGNPEVISYLKSVAVELMTKYDLDGLHIDDYFYPDGLKADKKEWNDDALYALYGGGLSLEKWRESNINKVVKALYDGVKETKPNKIFGVSPAGRLPLTRYLYADPVQWVEQGTVDYLAPQVYWPHSHSTAPFLSTMNTWKEVTLAGGADNQIPVITGLAVYRLTESGFSLAEFKQQVEDCRNADWVVGNLWFRTKHLLASNFAPYLKSDIYTHESLVPKLGKGFKNNTGAPATPAIQVNGKKVEWTAVTGAEGYAIYELVKKSSTSSSTTWTAELITKGELLSYPGTSKKNYAVISYNGKNRSALSAVVYVE